ncbi:MAG: Cys-tRNA(Pro) deacylase [Acidimicrobiales bacterium]
MTPAVDLLRALGIAHEVLEYHDHPGGGPYGENAARALGVDPTSVFKTLLATLDDGSTVVGIVPVPTRLDLKALATAAGAKRAEMAEATVAERRTGYVVGGISPFGQKRPSPTYVDEWATALDTVLVSGGRRGLELAVPPHAFADALDARFVPIASWP